MRKLTGYIGAMIIVFALMGSVLAGYALNVNGESAVINEYDHVTDVSGLYSYSEEKTYIDYNPASNYIGYNVLQADSFTINNITELGNHRLYYNVYTDNVANGAWNTSQYASGAFYNNGGIVQYSTSGDQTGNRVYPIVTGEKLIVYVYNPDSTKFSATITEWSSGTSHTYHSGNFTISYTPGTITMILDGTTTITSTSDWVAIPANGGNSAIIAGADDTGYFQGNQFYEQDGQNATITPINEYNGQPTYNLYTATIINANEWGFVPKTVEYQPTIEPGVNYSPSTRVNNYPIVTDPGNTSHIHTQVDLTSISASDYWNRFNIPNGQAKMYYIVMTTPEHNDLDFSDNTASFFTGPWYKSDGTVDLGNNTVPHYYRLIDILNTLNIPSGVSSVKITANSNDLRNENVAGDYSTTNWRFDANLAFISSGDDWVYQRFGFNTNTAVVGAGAGTKDYAIYNINNSTIDIYDYAGVKKATKSTDNVYIGFISGGTNYGYAEDNPGGLNNGGVLPMANRPTPFITLDYDIVNGESIEYIDITKGFIIDPTNINDVIWDNGYENGLIQILFRASSLDQAYHNELTVNNDVINIDFTNNRFYVTLNNGDSVDIGTWRNIVLNVDLINGNLSAIPVRTFNNFTNVRLDNTNIEIGNISATPTNVIKWSQTLESLNFNVYQTSVFMNTYGVVMANPSINITNYFTNLDNFYELKLTNFSIFGDSITVNGQTFPVDDNIITVGNESLIIKDLSIMYADGHAYLADSHVTVDIGEITDNVVSMTGAWYFQTELLKGSTAQKMIYEWDWQGFVFDNTEFCIFYIGLAVAALLIARRFCQLTIIDYSIFIVSIIIALGVQVIA